MNVQAIRADFPLLSIQHDGKPLVYLDNAATTQKPRAVLNAMQEVYERFNANVHRGIYFISEEATQHYEAAREIVRSFINADDVESIIFTKNATEAINLVAHAWGRKFVGSGDEIILTEMEHHSNIVPWQILAKDTGALLKFVGLHNDGTLQTEQFAQLLSPRTKLVAVTHMSNVLGTINPLDEIVRIAHSHDVPVLIDGAQGAAHLSTDVRALDCEFYVFSGHKMLGPTGVGILYGKRSFLEDMDPFLGGGEMIMEVKFETSTYKDPPYKFEAGTPNIIEAIGLGAAINYLLAIGMDSIFAHEIELTNYTLGALDDLGGVAIHGPRTNRGGLISFSVDGVPPHDVAQILDSEGVAVRAGHHCAQPLMRWLNVPATTRASFYLYNTRQEADAFVKAIDKAKSLFN